MPMWHRIGFESYVNSAGSKAFTLDEIRELLFESYVNSAGSKAHPQAIN